MDGGIPEGSAVNAFIDQGPLGGKLPQLVAALPDIPKDFPRVPIGQAKFAGLRDLAGEKEVPLCCDRAGNAQEFVVRLLHEKGKAEAVAEKVPVLGDVQILSINFIGRLVVHGLQYASRGFRGFHHHADGLPAQDMFQAYMQVFSAVGDSDSP